jgi:serine/threonine protein kinase/tetratricopeptide (TPR) repeat protein
VTEDTFGSQPTEALEETREGSGNDSSPLDPAPGGTVGAYRLLRRLGEGGMGEIFLAEQQTPRRQVALKVIKRGMDTRKVIARFETERQALALMSHSNIARVFDAGETERGRPFFVMEYVQGEPISAYCDRHRLSTKKRLELFLQVCEGVQHAHQKAVIHRDLKPSNILVTVVGDLAVPKIIDFGVAKATSQPLTEGALMTELGQMVGTPEYMSPEQAEMSGLDVDTRTDVYSLGVVLYELLVGALPFDSKELRAAGLSEIQRRIREEEPSRPSTRLSTLGEDSKEVAQRRSTDRVSLARVLKGDLDWITMKALEKDRTRRYGSASELAADIRRHLNDQPVLARPPDFRYRAGRYVRRHRLGVLAAALVSLALIVGGVATAWQARVAGQERDLAERRFAEVRQLANSLVFELHDAIADLPGSTPARRLVVERGLEYLDRLSVEANDDADLLTEVAQGYIRTGDVQGLPFSANLGDAAGARVSYDKARQLFQTLVEREPANTAALRGLGRSNLRLGELLYSSGTIEQAKTFLEEAERNLVAASSAMPDDPELRRDRITVNEDLAKLYAESGRMEQAVAAFQKNLTIEIELLRADPENPERLRDVAVTELLMAEVLRVSGRDSAIELLHKATDRMALLLAANPESASHQREASYFKQLLAFHLEKKGELEEASRLLDEIRPTFERLVEQDPKNALLLNDLIVSCNQEAEILIEQDRPSAAIETLGEALQIESQLARGLDLVDEEANLAETHRLLGRAHSRLGNVDDASSQYQRALEYAERDLALQPSSALVKSVLADLYYERAAFHLEAAGLVSASPNLACEAARSDFERARKLDAELEAIGSQIQLDRRATEISC